MIFSEPSSSTTFLFIYFPTTHFLSPSSARLVPLLSPGPSSCRQRYLSYCLEHHPTDSTPSMLGNPPPPFHPCHALETSQPRPQNAANPCRQPTAYKAPLLPTTPHPWWCAGKLPLVAKSPPMIEKCSSSSHLWRKKLVLDWSNEVQLPTKVFWGRLCVVGGWIFDRRRNMEDLEVSPEKLDDVLETSQILMFYI